MKKFTLFSLIIGMLFSVSSFAQNVPNGDFEEWEDGQFGYEVPIPWWTVGILTGYQDVTKVSPGQDSDFAAKLTPVEIPGVGVSSVLLTNFSFGVAQKYGLLSLYVEGTSVGADTLFVYASMLKDGNPIGASGGIVSGVIDNFTKFDFPVTYQGTESPDSCIVVLMLGKSDGTANVGSEYTIDNVFFSGLAAIDDIESAFSAVGNPYPNPANNVVSVPFELKEPSDVTLKVYDMLGRQVYSLIESSYSQGSNEISIDVNDLGAGPYFYTLSSGKNSVTTRTFVVR